MATTVCPSCAAALAVEEGHSPWCERCEWQLDRYENRPAFDWPWSTFDRLDHRYGFRFDRAMVSEADVTGKPRASASEWLLRLVSLVLVLGVAAVAGFGVWLVITFHNGLSVVGALGLFGIAYLFRPRLGRLKPLPQGTYRLSPDKHEAFFGMLERIAEATGARIPDWVVMDTSWNAMTAVVGFRRKRVLRLGFPLWISLRPQERVALLGHEMGHFTHEDSLRHLLIQPALSHFGRLTRVVKPPTSSTHRPRAVRHRRAHRGRVAGGRQILGLALRMRRWPPPTPRKRRARDAATPSSPTSTTNRRGA